MIKLTGARVIDPAHDVNESVRDLYMHEGRMVAERGTLKAVSFGAVHTVKPEFDRGIERELEDYFSRYQTQSLASFTIGDDELRSLGRARDLLVHPCLTT